MVRSRKLTTIILKAVMRDEEVTSLVRDEELTQRDSKTVIKSDAL